MKARGGEPDQYHVAFQDIGFFIPVGSSMDLRPDEGSNLIEQLERELTGTRDDLERTVQDLEAANEELKSGNEELLSMNEELQASNEELETAKEDMVSANDNLLHAYTDLENLFASTQVATLFLDAQGKLRQMNSAAAEIYNVRPSDIGRALTDFTHSAREIPPMPTFETVMTLSKPIENEVQLLDGRFYLRRVLPYKTHEGAATGVVVTFIDLTERKTNERELQVSEERFRLMADNAPALIWKADEQMMVTWLNKPWQEFVGKPIEELLETGLLADINPEDLPECEAVFKSAVARQSSFEINYRMRSKSGAWRWFLNHGRSLFDAGGQYVGFIGSCFDITEQREAQDLLREADRRKDQFLATLAHELRNPLAPLRTGLAMLNQSPEAAQAGKTLDMMERQVAHMVRLIDDLMDVSRISQGRINLKKERVDIRTIIGAAVEESAPIIGQANHELSIRLPNEPVNVNADSARIVQAVSNLLINAAKYTPNEGKIDIDVQSTDDEVVIRVTDSGVGIPAELVPMLFEPFSQADRTLPQSQGGLGLGLSLVRWTVENHGGYVRVQSEGVGLGSQFIIHLPSMPPDARPEAPQAVQSHQIGGAARRILVVDDNRDGAEVLSLLLSRDGHQVKTAHSGKEAIQIANEFTPEIVLLDIGLPEMSGHEVARTLRQSPKLANVILVAITGWGADTDKKKALESGFNFHMTKPVEVKALRDLIRNLVQN
jgi:two-component system CheB/CheR fusion protein